MFITLLSILASISVYAQVSVDSHPHLLFEHAPQIQEGGELVTTKSRINNRIPGHGPSYIVVEWNPTLNLDVPAPQYLMERSLGEAVFKARTGTGTAQGTAFLVDRDVVLTNRHVLANSSECNKFGIHINNSKEFVACKEVLYCSTDHDFCVIQMNAMSDGTLLGDAIRPLTLTKKKPKKDAMTMIIGNPLASGIHAASYRGIVDKKTDWGHFNFALSGNSGSPLFNDAGEVIGIHYGRAEEAKVHGGPDDRAIGLAVKVSTMLKETDLLEAE